MRSFFLASLLPYGPALRPEHDQHQAGNQRGDQVMGFSNENTEHHFRLNTEGDAMEVGTIDPNERDGRDQITLAPHLSRILRGRLQRTHDHSRSDSPRRPRAPEIEE